MPKFHSNKIKKILVTGASGQLGKTLAELFSQNDLGLEFYFVDRKDLDITNKDQLQSFFKQNTFDFCINCAAYTNVEQAEKTPEIAYKINTEGVKSLAQSCKKYNIVLIHISTDYVFDGETEMPYKPEDKPNPINEYGKSKFLGEKHIIELLDKYYIVRTSWLYSKKHGKNFYKTIVHLAQTKPEISVTTDQVGCPTNTESLAKYIISLIVNNKEDYGIKHFSDDEVMTWYDFANKILSENNLKMQVKLVEGSNYITFAKRPKFSVLMK